MKNCVIYFFIFFIFYSEKCSAASAETGLVPYTALVASSLRASQPRSDLHFDTPKSSYEINIGGNARAAVSGGYHENKSSTTTIKGIKVGTMTGGTLLSQHSPQDETFATASLAAASSSDPDIFEGRSVDLLDGMKPDDSSMHTLRGLLAASSRNAVWETTLASLSRRGNVFAKEEYADYICDKASNNTRGGDITSGSALLGTANRYNGAIGDYRRALTLYEDCLRDYKIDSHHYKIIQAKISRFTQDHKTSRTNCLFYGVLSIVAIGATSFVTAGFADDWSFL